jgi:hypothetical protein
MWILNFIGRKNAKSNLKIAKRKIMDVHTSKPMLRDIFRHFLRATKQRQALMS